MFFTTFTTLVNLSLIALAVARPTPLNSETTVGSPNRRDIENTMNYRRGITADEARDVNGRAVDVDVANDSDRNGAWLISV
ncbi:hypothetical protein C8J57DRAFT_1319530, partial [Mycena rebaudengoi]